MIDAILHAVKDNIIGGGFKYDFASCDVRDSGKPPPRCGDYFVSVHQAQSTSDLMNCLNEYFDFMVTMTMRTRGIPYDRIGDQLLAIKTAQQTGFNRRCNQLAVFLHMDWGILQDANTYLQTMMPDVATIYGFSEPAHFAGMETPRFEGAEWFDADPDDATQVALVASLAFAQCRRGPQAIAFFS